MLKKSITKQWVFLFVLMVFLFMRTYSVERDVVFSEYSFIFLAVCTIIFAFAALSRDTTSINRNNISLILIYIFIFPLMLFATIVNTNNLAYSGVLGLLNNILFQVVFIIFLFSLSSIYNTSPNQWLDIYSKFFILFALISSFSAFERFYTGSTLFGPLLLEGSRWPQLYGWYSSPNFFINVVAIGLLSTIYQILNKKTLIIYIPILVFLSTILLLTGSRGGILALLISLSFFFILKISLSQSKLTLIDLLKTFSLFIAILFVVVMIIWIYFSTNNLDLNWLTTQVLRLHTIYSGSGRLSIWADYYNILADKSTLSLIVGLGNEYFISNHGRSMHSAHFKIIFEYGLLSYMLLFIVLVGVLLKTIKIINKSTSVSFIIMSTMVYIWIKTFFNAGLLSADVIGLSFIFFVYLSGFIEKEAVK